MTLANSTDFDTNIVAHLFAIPVRFILLTVHEILKLFSTISSCCLLFAYSLKFGEIIFNSTRLDTLSLNFPFQIALFGLLSYIISLYLIHKSELYHNVFGVLCTAYALFHIQTVSTILFWTIIRIIE